MFQEQIRIQLLTRYEVSGVRSWIATPSPVVGLRCRLTQDSIWEDVDPGRGSGTATRAQKSSGPAAITLKLMATRSRPDPRAACAGDQSLLNTGILGATA